MTSPWGNEDTQELIDILARYNVKATFFVVGDWVDKYPESVKALHDAGHEVMNHSNTHAHMSKLSREEIIADVEACSDKIEAVTGVRPTLIRPPYGEYNDTVISAIRSIGMEPIQWDVDGSQTDSSPCPPEHTHAWRNQPLPLGGRGWFYGNRHSPPDSLLLGRNRLSSSATTGQVE